MQYPTEHSAQLAVALRDCGSDAIRAAFWLLILTWGDPNLLEALVSLVRSWS